MVKTCNKSSVIDLDSDKCAFTHSGDLSIKRIKTEEIASQTSQDKILFAPSSLLGFHSIPSYFAR